MRNFSQTSLSLITPLLLQIVIPLALHPSKACGSPRISISHTLALLSSFFPHHFLSKLRFGITAPWQQLSSALPLAFPGPIADL
jgi:hypothetical protein